MGKLDSISRNVLSGLADPMNTHQSSSGTFSSGSSSVGSASFPAGGGLPMINVANLISTNNMLKSQSNAMKNALGETGQKMNSVPDANGFSGNMQKQMKGYTEETHIGDTQKLSSNLDVLTAEFDSLLSVFKGVDGSDSAIIKNSLLEDLIGQLSGVPSQNDSAVSAANKGAKMAENAFAEVTMLSKSTSTAINDTKKHVIKVKEQMEEFNGLGVNLNPTQISNDWKNVHVSITVNQMKNKKSKKVKLNGKSKTNKSNSKKKDKRTVIQRGLDDYLKKMDVTRTKKEKKIIIKQIRIAMKGKNIKGKKLTSLIQNTYDKWANSILINKRNKAVYDGIADDFFIKAAGKMVSTFKNPKSGSGFENVMTAIKTSKETLDMYNDNRQYFSPQRSAWRTTDATIIAAYGAPVATAIGTRFHIPITTGAAAVVGLENMSDNKDVEPGTYVSGKKAYIQTMKTYNEQVEHMYPNMEGNTK
ncbi:hypothetical protein [Companilactobacillus sp.]|jgi:hypothetical protein|uniref:hypothetical protein n=1 Tax=Companilactobacillus sp. TaxID=2767905 RepID=UPI0025BDCB64|nr:hypothetical protein [Companilactobacillus sp.]MCH4009492.1 hypothetical protein [Companilactobacillus sp.]MCH4052832.1 hypothetical protein [Companilactobacillus sp.]MCH4077434.1 hypothetical protein [Companilactobacillus sp.]MCH4126010.1 hypothetical protein [Companilactobacillus sp.]MCI1311718.1 hypothetical protein [Companilactobacillus sp.]